MGRRPATAAQPLGCRRAKFSYWAQPALHQPGSLPDRRGKAYRARRPVRAPDDPAARSPQPRGDNGDSQRPSPPYLPASRPLRTLSSQNDSSASRTRRRAGRGRARSTRPRRTASRGRCALDRTSTDRAGRRSPGTTYHSRSKNAVRSCSGISASTSSRRMSSSHPSRCSALSSRAAPEGHAGSRPGRGACRRAAARGRRCVHDLEEARPPRSRARHLAARPRRHAGTWSEPHPRPPRASRRLRQ